MFQAPHRLREDQAWRCRVVQPLCDSQVSGRDDHRAEHLPRLHTLPGDIPPVMEDAPQQSVEPGQQKLFLLHCLIYCIILCMIPAFIQHQVNKMYTFDGTCECCFPHCWLWKLVTTKRNKQSFTNHFSYNAQCLTLGMKMESSLSLHYFVINSCIILKTWILHVSGGADRLLHWGPVQCSPRSPARLELRPLPRPRPPAGAGHLLVLAPPQTVDRCYNLFDVQIYISF